MLEQNNIYDPTIPDRINILLSKQINDTDRNIVVSMKSHIDKKGGLTPRQHDFFLVIESRYSDEKIKASNDWLASYDEEKKNLFELAVKYYKYTQYFNDVCRIVMMNPKYIPTEKQFKAMTANKYFQRALENYNNPPRYNLADLVVFRDNRKTYGRDKGMIFLIEGVDEQPSFTTRGRIYKLLILGQEDSISVFEDEIKLYRPKKEKNV